ncbi:unnamed protein product [Calypogeia fissa]
MALIAAILIVLQVLRSCSPAESRVVPFTEQSSRDVNCVGLAQPISVSNETVRRRSLLESSPVGLEVSNNAQVPALFIFGDSTVDVGNNNHLATLAQATFWPYGKDFDTHLPTGRFSDGRLSVDFIANYLGLPLVPSFASGTGFTQGVNFASAGSGVLSDTGSVFGEVISFSEQLKNFETVQQMVETEVGAPQALKIMSESIYYISTGSNDFINNFLLPTSPYWQLDSTDFEQLVLANFTQHVRTLFKMGARKIVVVSLSPLGCLPSQLFKMGSIEGACISPVNKLAMDYNAILAESLHSLRRHLPGAMLAYNDAYLAFSNLIDNAAFHGIKHTNQSCCGTGLYGGMKPCLSWTSICQNTSDYLFWDEFHPTAASYKLIADSFWSGPIELSSPWNVKTLASL